MQTCVVIAVLDRSLQDVRIVACDGFQLLTLNVIGSVQCHGSILSVSYAARISS